MCDRCQEFCSRFYAKAGREYRDLVRQLIDFVDRGVFKVISANVPMAEILSSQTWPADELRHVFVCLQCGRTFKLFFNTYKSNEAMWEALLPDPPSSIQ
jgi:hypothetical protein